MDMNMGMDMDMDMDMDRVRDRDRDWDWDWDRDRDSDSDSNGDSYCLPDVFPTPSCGTIKLSEIISFVLLQKASFAFIMDTKQIEYETIFLSGGEHSIVAIGPSGLWWRYI